MQMTEEEIARDYRLSANPRKQITVLAELNQTNTETIKRILERKGELHKKSKPREHKKKEEPEAEIPCTIRKILEKRIMDLNEEIVGLENERSEIEHFLGWDEVNRVYEQKVEQLDI